jgi:hypothetical protein
VSAHTPEYLARLATRNAWRSGAFGRGADLDLDQLGRFHDTALAQYASTCHSCGGTGYEVQGDGPNARDVACACRMCPTCEGSGIDDVDVEQTPEGLAVTDIPCRDCVGGVRS